MNGVKINKRQLRSLIVILAVAKDQLKDKYNQYLASTLHRQLSLLLEEGDKK